MPVNPSTVFASAVFFIFCDAAAPILTSYSTVIDSPGFKLEGTLASLIGITLFSSGS